VSPTTTDNETEIASDFEAAIAGTIKRRGGEDAGDLEGLSPLERERAALGEKVEKLEARRSALPAEESDRDEEQQRELENIEAQLEPALSELRRLDERIRRGVELDDLQRAAEQEIARLEIVEGEISFELLDDPSRRPELEAAQSQRAAALARVRQCELARSESDRRLHAEAQAEQQAKRAEALAAARKLAPRVLAAAEGVDESAARFAKSLATFSSLSAALDEQARAAGRRMPKAIPSAPQNALVQALVDAEVPRGLLEFAGVNQRPSKLVAVLPALPLHDD
jgi:hypothetical protein